MTLPEMLEGKVITTARVDEGDGCLYLQLGKNEAVIVLQVLTWGAAETDGATLQ